MKLEKQIMINGSECGYDAELSILGAISIIENVVTELMGTLKIDGITAQKKYGAMWVFSKNKLKMGKRIIWGEIAIVECFLSNISAVRMIAEVVIKNLKGELICHSMEEICAIDLESKRIRKVETVGAKESMIYKYDIEPLLFEKIDASNLNFIENRVIKSTSIDFCHHTNNKEYVRFILDSYANRDFLNKPIKEFQIDYVNQSFEGETIDILRRSDNNFDVIEVMRNNDVIVKAQIWY